MALVVVSWLYGIMRVLAATPSGAEAVAVAPVAIAPPAAVIPSRSPIFGINMSLYTPDDELVTSASTQALLRGLGVPLIRVPLRSTMSDADLTRAMQAVLAVGATPLLILQGPGSGSLARNQHLLGLITKAYGTRQVFLEYGNEADLAGVSADAYTAAWNEVVPALKQAAPAGYKFVGPVNFQFNPAYAASFAQNAQPTPDFLSWHEYVCNSSNPDSYCLDHIANWATHANAVQSAVRNAVGHTIPFFISEYNLDPNDTPRYADTAFIQNWTAKAINQLLELAPLGLAGAMIYTATNHGNFGLIESGQLTPQGEAFQTLISKVPAPANASASPSGTPAPVTVTPQPPPTTVAPAPNTSRSSPTKPSPNATASGSQGVPSTVGKPGAGASTGTTVRIGFETGLDGWAEYWGYDKLVLSRTDNVHLDGDHSMLMATSATGYVAAGTKVAVSNLSSGDRVVFHVHTSGAGAGKIRPFVMDGAYAVHFPQDETALPDSAGWFAVSFVVPPGVSVRSIGLQLHAESPTSIAMDSLSWPA